MGLFGGGGTPKYLKKAGKKLMNEAWDVYNSTNFTPYSGDPIAPMNEKLSTAIDRAGAVGQSGTDAFNRALSTADAGSRFMPTPIAHTNVAPTTVGSAAPMTAAQMDYVPNVAPQNAVAGSILNTNIDEYMNPYLRSVIDSTMTDLNRNREVQRAADKAAGAGAGAFTNDDRMQVLTGERTGEYDRTAARTIADLYSSGYDRATGLATSDLDRAYAASTGNADRTMMADKSNQDMMFNTGMTNAGYAQDAAAATHAANVARAEQQATIDAEAAIANAENTLATGQTNIMAGLEGNQQRLMAADVMSGIGEKSRAGAVDAAALGLQASGVQQAYDQLLPSFQYDEFGREVNWPFQKMGLLTGAINSIGGQKNGESIMSGISGFTSSVGNLLTGIGNLK